MNVIKLIEQQNQNYVYKKLDDEHSSCKHKLTSILLHICIQKIKPINSSFGTSSSVIHGGLGGTTGSASDSRSEGRGFDSH